MTRRLLASIVFCLLAFAGAAYAAVGGDITPNDHWHGGDSPPPPRCNHWRDEHIKIVVVEYANHHGQTVKVIRIVDGGWHRICDKHDGGNGQGNGNGSGNGGGHSNGNGNDHGPR